MAIIDTIKALTVWLSAATEGIASLIIAAAVVEAAVRVVLLPVRRRGHDSAADSHEAKEEIRLRLGRWLAVALEFELGADILRTAVAPSWSEIGQLAAIAAVRTALNFFLQREIDKAAVRRDSVGGTPQAVPGGDGGR